MLHTEFSSSAPSLLASCALYLAMIKFEINYAPHLEFINSNLLQVEIFQRYATQMNSLVLETLKANKVCREIVSKYSTPSKYYVARYFTPEK